MYSMNIDLHTMNIDLHKVFSSVPCVNIVLYQKCRNEQKQLKYLYIKKKEIIKLKN